MFICFSIATFFSIKKMKILSSLENIQSEEEAKIKPINPLSYQTDRKTYTSLKKAAMKNS